MTKSEIRKAKDNELITEYVKSHSTLCLNYNLGGGLKMITKHCKDLEEELIARGLLTKEDIRSINCNC